jgi:hypothetical protein
VILLKIVLMLVATPGMTAQAERPQNRSSKHTQLDPGG